MEKRNYKDLISTMLKIGFIGFGGGTALIPVIEEEVVEQKKLVTEEQFNSDVVIASITPGALPVEIATGIGHEVAGNRGMMAASTAMAFPGAFLTILFLVLLSSADAMVKTQIGFLAVGISAYIILTLANYCTGTIKQARNKNEARLYLAMMLGVFVLCGEKNVYALFGMEATPIFGISTLQILGSAFFVILYVEGELRNYKRSLPALGVAGIYFLCVGKAHLIPLSFKPYIMGFMVILAIYGLIQSVKDSGKKMKFPWKNLCKTLFVWIVFVIVLSIPAFIVSREIIGFLAKGIFSSVMSFGGGDAYLTVAQGLFVDEGIISYHDFFGSIVSIANALPGSILCKVLSGMGYMFGYNMHQSVAEGLAMGLSAFVCSVAASGTIFEIVSAIYQKYERLLVFAVVKHFIRPIISGLLLNVAISMYLTGIASQTEVGIALPALLLISVIVIGGNYLMNLKKNVHLLWRILFSMAISFVGCNLFLMI